MRLVLVTGAAGFCGRHLCSQLIKNGYKVMGSYHRVPPPRKSPHPFVYLDICDRASVDSVIEKWKPDYVCHLAAQSVLRFSWKMPDKTLEVNAAGTIFLLDAIRKFVPKTRFLQASSIQVYGHMFSSGKPVKETDLLWPSDPYAASKMVAEFACLEFASRFGLDVVIGRAFNHVGLGQPTHFVFPDWCRQIAMIEAGQKKPVLEVGNLKNRRDFLHVSDVARAYEVILRKGKSGSAYNIAGGTLYSLEECMKFLMNKAFASIEVKVAPARVRQDISPDMHGDPSRLRALGWKPELTVFDAIEELLNFWRLRIRMGRGLHEETTYR
ncbi:MAG: GDP-mannose 4,6-dehydratase [Candidatus Omnitrophica bacterium]|nr:GDP-mannose 4,6-dehydratase [Candidatus Omnitrophota bacterium]